MKSLMSFSLGILLLILFQQNSAEAKPRFERINPPANSSLYGKVHRHSDGDTMDVEVTRGEFKGKVIRIRLIGIDTPEKNHMGRTQGPIADEASATLKKLVPVGTNVRVRVDDVATGPFGRVLGTIFEGKININKEMIYKGMAFPITFAPTFKYHEDYWEAARVAERKGRGVWARGLEVEIPHRFRAEVAGGETHFVADFASKTIFKKFAIDAIDEDQLIFVPTNSGGEISLGNFLKKWNVSPRQWKFVDAKNLCEVHLAKLR